VCIVNVTGYNDFDLLDKIEPFRLKDAERIIRRMSKIKFCVELAVSCAFGLKIGKSAKTFTHSNKV
jgi:hypothetical protein